MSFTHPAPTSRSQSQPPVCRVSLFVCAALAFLFFGSLWLSLAPCLFLYIPLSHPPLFPLCLGRRKETSDKETTTTHFPRNTRRHTSPVGLLVSRLVPRQESPFATAPVAQKAVSTPHFTTGCDFRRVTPFVLLSLPFCAIFWFIYAFSTLALLRILRVALLHSHLTFFTFLHPYLQPFYHSPSPPQRSLL